nr:ribonuclease H-like domain-containing protein [Tanacetum cinerariifolium]
MAFISSAKHISRNEDSNTASVPTASTNVPTAGTSVATISQDTTCAYIASQSSGSQIKFEDINQIDKDDMEDIDIKWNMALLSMRADKFWKKTRKKISIQGSDMVGFDKLKVECFNCHKMGYFARECRAPKSQDRGRRDTYKQGSKAKEQASKAGLEFRTESNNECIEILKKKLEILKKEKEGVDGKLAGFLTASKDLDNLIESQRADKNKDGLRYSDVPPPPAQIYYSPKIDLNPSVFETEASPSAITPKPFIKFVKASDSQTESKIDKAEKAKKSLVTYAEQYRKTNKKPIKKGENGTSIYQDDTYKSFTPRPGDYRPYRPSQRPIRSNMNGARPNRTTFNKQAYSYSNRHFQRTSAVKSQYRAPWVPTVNRNLQPANKKISTGSRNFSTANRKFPTASRKFPIGSTKCSTADMGMRGKAVKPSACWFWKPS